jgi:hypothetical protein
VAQAASAPSWLASAPLDHLLAVWAHRGASYREYGDGSIELLARNAERIVRASPAVITEQLRVRLAAA